MKRFLLYVGRLFKSSPLLWTTWKVVLLVAIAILSLGAAEVLAADEQWPALPLEKGWRGPGGYLSWFKIGACWLLFLLWVATTDWVNRDLQEHKKLPYLKWNPIVFGPFIGAFILVWFIPWFWFDLPLLLAAYAAPLTIYILERNKRMEPHERVMTRAHIRFWISQRMGKVGVKVAAEKADPHEVGPPIKLLARGAPSDAENAGRLVAARQHPGLRAIREILAGGLSYRSTALMLDYTAQGVAVRYMIDGVWVDREPEEREKADPGLESLKLLCGLKPQERQAKQEGPFVAEYQGNRLEGTLACQGTPNGERAVVQFEEKRIRFESLEALGMRQKLQEQFMQLLEAKQGLLLFSALPGAGLRSTTAVALRSTDRLMREFVAIEDLGHPYEPVENVPVQTYKGAAGETPLTLLPRVLRTDPNVIVVRDLVNAETVTHLCREAAPERLVISTTWAKDSAEALLRVLALKVPPADFAKAAIGVVYQRLVRKLCECKEAYQPPPEVLKQLGIPEGRVPAFYRPPEPPPPEEKKREICKKCNGIGYFGRTAIFELLPVGEYVRKVLATSPKLELLRSAGRKDGMRTLQEEGVLLVAKGVTSLPELMRVLKT